MRLMRDFPTPNAIDLEDLLDDVHEMLYEYDPEVDRFTWVSAGEGLLGYPREAWLRPGFWASIIHPEDRERAIRWCADVCDSRAERMMEYRLVSASGRVASVREVVRPGRNGNGLVMGHIADITAVRTLEEELGEADHRAIVGGLASGIAHDLSQPLTLILTNLSFAADELRASGDAALGAIDDARAAARLAKNALLEFHSVFRGVDPRREAVDIGAALRTCLAAVRAAVPAGRTVTVDIDPALPKVEAPATAPGRIFLNLLTNAIDALRESGTELAVRAHRAGSDVVVEIEDDGPGVPPEIAARLFEPFATGRASGTGLGLWNVRRLVAQIGGSITIPTRSRGTLVCVTLPAIP